jgi:hypothetical protein
VGEPPRATPGLRGFYEPNLHTPLVLLNPKMFPEGRPAGARVSHRLGGHRDLLPTILDALGLPADPRHQGQSLLGADYEHRRQFFAADNGRYVGFIEGHHKFALEPRAQRVEYYDLATDPEELEDISDQDPALMRLYTDDALLFERAVKGRIESAPVLHEAVSVAQVYELFMEHARVRVLPPKRRLLPDGGVSAPEQPRECELHGDEIECPGLSVPLQVDKARVQGELRRCVQVPVPAEGAIELEVEHPETMALMTGTVVALPRRYGKDARLRIRTYADGRSQGSVSLDYRMPARPVHPRPQKSIRFQLERRKPHKPLRAPDGGVRKPNEDDTVVCLQLTALLGD